MRRPVAARTERLTLTSPLSYTDQAGIMHGGVLGILCGRCCVSCGSKPQVSLSDMTFAGLRVVTAVD